MFALDPTLLLFFLIAFISKVIGAIAGLVLLPSFYL